MQTDSSNSSVLPNGTTPTPQPTAFPEDIDLRRLIPLTIVLVLLDCSAVLGNSVVIIAVVRERSLRTTTNFFVVSLALSDLFLSVLVLPFSILNEVVGYWLFDQYFCVFWAAIDVLICTASILNLVAISLDRYLAISKPMHYPKFSTNRNSAIVIFIVWFLATAISLPPLFGWRQSGSDLYKCELTSGKGYVTYSALGSFYIPAAILLFVYSRIYVAAAKATRDIKRGRMVGEIRTLPYIKETGENGQTTALYSSNYRQSCGSTSSQDPFFPDGRNKNKDTFAKRLRKFTKDKKAAKTLAIVVGCFLLCWSPFFLVYLITGVCKACKVPELMFKIFFWLGYCNSCFNPIIYPCLNRDFRRAFKKIFLKMSCMRRKTRRSVRHLPTMSTPRTLRLSIPESMSSGSPPDSPTIAVTRRQSQFREIRKASLALASTVLATTSGSRGLQQRNQIQFAIPNVCQHCHKGGVVALTDEDRKRSPSEQPNRTLNQRLLKTIATQTDSFEILRRYQNPKDDRLLNCHAARNREIFASETNVDRLPQKLRQQSSASDSRLNNVNGPISVTGTCSSDAVKTGDGLPIKLSDEILISGEIAPRGSTEYCEGMPDANREWRRNYKPLHRRQELIRSSSLQTPRSKGLRPSRGTQYSSLSTLCRVPATDTTRLSSVRPTRRVGYDHLSDGMFNHTTYAAIRL